MSLFWKVAPITITKKTDVLSMASLGNSAIKGNSRRTRLTLFPSEVDIPTSNQTAMFSSHLVHINTAGGSGYTYSTQSYDN